MLAFKDVLKNDKEKTASFSRDPPSPYIKQPNWNHRNVSQMVLFLKAVIVVVVSAELNFSNNTIEIDWQTSSCLLTYQPQKLYVEKAERNMNCMSRVIAAVLIVLLTVVLVPQTGVLAQTPQIQHQSLGFSKQYFIYQMGEELDHYNNLKGSQASLENESSYYPLADRRDGWEWEFSSGVAVVAVGGPENNLEEALFVGALPNGCNNSQIREVAVGIFAFEDVIWGQGSDLSTAANDWIYQQLASDAPQSDTQIGDKLVTWLYLYENGYSCFGIRVFGQEVAPAPLPWWTILGILTGVIGLSTAGWKAASYIGKKRKTLPPPPPPPPAYTRV